MNKSLNKESENNQEQPKQTRIFLRSLCVICGARDSKDQELMESVKHLGENLEDKGIAIVYGGAGTGLMGQLATASLQNGGAVIGVMPADQDWGEVTQKGLTELVMTNDLSSRKQEMFKRADAILALPGGFGTMDELFEAITMTQLGIQNKPIGIWNYKNFYGALMGMIGISYSSGFIEKEYSRYVKSSNNLYTLIKELKTFVADSNVIAET